MDSIWTVLGIDPTEDVSAIKRAYAEHAKTCHPEEDAEGFLQLRQAYQAALDYAGGTEEGPGFSMAGPLEEEPAPEVEEAGKKCPICGAESDSKFCPQCGAPMGE